MYKAEKEGRSKEGMDVYGGDRKKKRKKRERERERERQKDMRI